LCASEWSAPGASASRAAAQRSLTSWQTGASRPDAAASELIVLELYRQRRISRGKAAELLGEPLTSFLQRAARADIPYFDLTSEELQQEIESAEDFARARCL